MVNIHDITIIKTKIMIIIIINIVVSINIIIIVIAIVVVVIIITVIIIIFIILYYITIIIIIIVIIIIKLFRRDMLLLFVLSRSMSTFHWRMHRPRALDRSQWANVYIFIIIIIVIIIITFFIIFFIITFIIVGIFFTIIIIVVNSVSIQFNQVLTCTFGASCYSTRLSWAHTPVISWAAYLVLVVTLLEVSEREEGVVAVHLPIGPLKTHSGLEPVPRYEPST